MTRARTEDVRRFYEAYPYPYGTEDKEPDVLLTYMYRGYFVDESLAGWRVLDVGCGTGHKLAGLAASYPEAGFRGVELSSASAAVARELAAANRLDNLEIVHGNFLEADLGGPYDVVNAFGVVHHLEDPQLGLDRLAGALKPDGVLMVWLYHPLGEFDRLTRRELLFALWGEDRSDLALGERLMQDLGLELSPTHYGPRYGPDGGREASPLPANADAFMHPIVEAYRFDEGMAMLARAGMTWAAVGFVNLEGAVRGINLGEIDDPMMARFCLDLDELLPTPALRERYRSLRKRQRLRILELAVRPRGYQLLAGRGESHRRVTERMREGVVEL